MKKSGTLKPALDKVIAEMTGVMTRKEIIDAVLKHYATKAKNPGSSIMNDLSLRNEIVALGDAKYARADYVLDRAKFRIKISGEELALGIVKEFWFNPFNRVLPPSESIFISNEGDLIPVVTKGFDTSNLTTERLKSLTISLGENLLKTHLDAGSLPASRSSADDEDSERESDSDEEMDDDKQLERAREMLKEKLAQGIKMHDFSGFYQKYQVRAGDSLIVTMKPGERMYIFEHEPASKVQESLIQQRDGEISELIHKAIKRKKREDAREIIFQAYGNLAWLKEYPSSHWLDIVEKDDGLRLRKITPDYWEIASIDFRSIFDMFNIDETTKRKLQKRRESIEQEIDNFLERLDAAYQSVTERMTSDIDKGGTDNVIVKIREPRDRVKLYESNERLIDKFFEAEKRKRGNENSAGKKASDVALLASYLSHDKEKTLEEAAFNDLTEFLFDWYPRKVINSSPTHSKQLVASVRDFYRFLVERKVIRRAAFAEAAIKLRDLASEKIELYDRLPMEESGELYTRLFSR